MTLTTVIECGHEETMTRGAKEKVKLIEVKPVQADDRDHVLTFDESNVNASPGDGKPKFYTVNLLKAEENDLPACHVKSLSQDLNRVNINPDLKKEDGHEKITQILTKDINTAGELKGKVENEINKTNPGPTIRTHKEQGTEKFPGQIYAEKGKKKRKRGKKNKKEEKITESGPNFESKCLTTESEPNSDSNCKTTEEGELSSRSKRQTIKETSGEDEIAVRSENIKSENKGRKLPCLFGFISTWLAKRKERRRIKKRKAIETRIPTPETLVEYEHKKGRGGVAFTVEVDSRPMRKAVLPPIMQRPGPIVREIDEKLKHAEMKRSEELEKKKMSSKEHAKRKAECQDRKYENEFYFKQKVDLSIRHKQSGAQKNRARFHEDRRCSTPLLRAPSTLPPLRGTRVKQAAAADQMGISGLKNDPYDAIFDF